MTVLDSARVIALFDFRRPAQTDSIPPVGRKCQNCCLIQTPTKWYNPPSCPLFSVSEFFSPADSYPISAFRHNFHTVSQIYISRHLEIIFTLISLKSSNLLLPPASCFSFLTLLPCKQAYHKCPRLPGIATTPLSGTAIPK